MPSTAPGPGRLRLGQLLYAYAVCLVVVALGHATLLRLPYFWDEGGYYVPAALDFYHRWTLIPEFTNAHPPLPSIVLGLAWHLFGFHILVTRLVACAFAAAGLASVFALSRWFLSLDVALTVTALCAVYPIWFAQSSLAHADIFAAAFSLAGLGAYLTAPEQQQADLLGRAPVRFSSRRRLLTTAALFCLAAFSKETAVLQSGALLLLQPPRWLGTRREGKLAAVRWAAALVTPLPVLIAWFAYHHAVTGFTFGNPEFLRYNASANLSPSHITLALGYRALHLFWQRFIWLPLLLAAACLFLPARSGHPGLPRAVLFTIGCLVAVNWIAFSVLGGALLTRYLLPVYPLLLLIAVSLWWQRTPHWFWLAALTAAAFLSALWLNPPTYFAPEDNLTYRDMVVVHQEAIAWLQQHAPEATVLTAWPAAAELYRPELGYTRHRFKVFSVEDFSLPQVLKAAQQPGRYDAALVFSTHYITPAFQSYLLTHPRTRRGREYLQSRDLSPPEIARLLQGRVVWQDDRDGEWAAILLFDRRYDALLLASRFKALPSSSPR